MIISYHLVLTILCDSHQHFLRLETILSFLHNHSHPQSNAKNYKFQTWIWSLFFLHILSHMCSFQTNYPYYRGFYASFVGFQTNLAGNLHFWQLILAFGHLFLKLFQLAIQKWLPKYQIGWEHVPTVPIFLEPCQWLWCVQ